MTRILLSLVVYLLLINDNGFEFLHLKSPVHYSLELTIHLVEINQALISVYTNCY